MTSDVTVVGTAFGITITRVETLLLSYVYEVNHWTDSVRCSLVTAHPPRAHEFALTRLWELLCIHSADSGSELDFQQQRHLALKVMTAGGLRR